jgi:hypothetical protein
MKSGIRQLILVAALCPAAAASDWYVDAVAGNNANSGTSPSQAWRTITWAVSQVPLSGTQTIVVAPGTYNATSGETWPIPMRDALQIVGAGPASTTLVGTGADMFQFDGSSGISFGPNTRIEGMHLVGPGNQGSALSMFASYAFLSPTFVDLDIEGWSMGVTTGVWLSGQVSPTLDSVHVHHCNTGLHVLGASHLTATDSSFHANVGNGISIAGAHGTPQPTFRRCRIDGNGASGVFASAGDYDANGTFEDCSVSFNALHGWSCPSSFTISGRNALFVRSTIAFNGGKGIDGPDMFGFCGQLILSQSILWGHTIDLDYQGTVSATRNDIGDGSYNGVNGNFSADPLFRNVAAEDLRLSWGSPCIDVASVVPPAGTLDLDRRLRDIDGDLDTSETADLGAFEFRTLDVLGPHTLASILRWELHGPAGVASTLYWARKPLSTVPASTPFGQWDLMPNQSSIYRVTSIGPASSTTFQRSIPNAAFFVGQTFSFQALTDNPLAPNGKAYTNAVQFTILP